MPEDSPISDSTIAEGTESSSSPVSWFRSKRRSHTGEGAASLLGGSSSCSQLGSKPSPGGKRRSISPPSSISPQRRGHSPVEKSAKELRGLVQFFLDPHHDEEQVEAIAQELLFESLPRENVRGLRTSILCDERSRSSFIRKLHDEGAKVARVRITWHLTSCEAAAAAIEAQGIRCEEGHCTHGRYGRGGYVATSAAKANAYADSDGTGGLRHMFVVLALPDEEVLRGERGLRPLCTAADLPTHPTEYCFVDNARLHCVLRMDYLWVPTGRRSKGSAAAGANARPWRTSPIT